LRSGIIFDENARLKRAIVAISRTFLIGYPCAARLMEKLEEEGYKRETTE